jgi:glucosamine--fructose-6-phosphate aminotransferase (isomerizing)
VLSFYSNVSFSQFRRRFCLLLFPLFPFSMHDTPNKQAQGVTFTSETDTEVIAQLIGWLLKTSEKQQQQEGGTSTPMMSVKDATAKALSRCDGTWGIAVMGSGKPGGGKAPAGGTTNDDKAGEAEIVVACNGSPMVIGLGLGKTFIASEPAAFNRCV